jgi:hypothetical protein
MPRPIVGTHHLHPQIILLIDVHESPLLRYDDLLSTGELGPSPSQRSMTTAAWDISTFPHSCLGLLKLAQARKVPKSPRKARPVASWKARYIFPGSYVTVTWLPNKYWLPICILVQLFAFFSLLTGGKPNRAEKLARKVLNYWWIPSHGWRGWSGKS